MLRRVKNISWRDRLSNAQLYGQVPKLSTIIKRSGLALAGHVARHNEPAKILLSWTPDEARRRGRPNITLKDVLHEHTGLTYNELRTTMAVDKYGEKITSCHRTEDRMHYYYYSVILPISENIFF